VATTAIDSLKSQPAMIVITLLNVLVFGMLYFGVGRSQERRDTHFMEIINKCLSQRGMG